MKNRDDCVNWNLDDPLKNCGDCVNWNPDDPDNDYCDRAGDPEVAGFWMDPETNMNINDENFCCSRCPGFEEEADRDS